MNASKFLVAVLIGGCISLNIQAQPSIHTDTIARVDSSDRGAVTRIVDQETGIACYLYVPDKFATSHRHPVISCAQDIRAQAAVPSDASYTTVNDDQVEWGFK